MHATRKALCVQSGDGKQKKGSKSGTAERYVQKHLSRIPNTCGYSSWKDALNRELL
jgi:hypothetical protein